MNRYFRSHRMARRGPRTILSSRLASASAITIALAGGLSGCATVRSIPVALRTAIGTQWTEGGLFGQGDIPEVPPAPGQIQVPPMSRQTSEVQLASHLITPPGGTSSALLPGVAGAPGMWPTLGDSCLPAPVCPPLHPQPAPPDPMAEVRSDQNELKQTVDHLQGRIDTLETELQSARNTVQDVSISLQAARQELSDLTQEVRYWRREMQQSQAAAAQMHASDIAKLDELSRLLAELSGQKAADKPATDTAP